MALATRSRCDSYIAVESLFHTTLYHSRPFAMVTGILVKNSHTTHRSTNVPQATSSLQPQDTPNTRPALDQAVDKILAKVNSPLGENDVQAVVEALGKASGMYS